MENKIDFIGDIHGNADYLIKLLKKLGYKYNGKHWEHKSRKAFFLGDYIDRGPKQLETIKIVKNMCDNNQAQAIMGNHEFNAIAWFLQDENGDFLRSHEEKHLKQHKMFLEEINDKQHKEIVEWFLTLPIWVETEKYRAVHACWCNESIKKLKNHLNNGTIETKSNFIKIYQDKTLLESLKILLKGPKVKLEPGIHFYDEYGNLRNKIRIKWWGKEQTTFKDAALLPEKTKEKISNKPLQNNYHYTDKKPIFFGHYWMSSEQPTILRENIVCLDWSIAGKSEHKKLCSYRWNGEKKLSNNKLVWVQA